MFDGVMFVFNSNYFSTEITKLGLTPLRQNPVYTTVCILLNTAVMGKC